MTHQRQFIERDLFLYSANQHTSLLRAQKTLKTRRRLQFISAVSMLLAITFCTLGIWWANDYEIGLTLFALSVPPMLIAAGARRIQKRILLAS